MDVPGVDVPSVLRPELLVGAGPGLTPAGDDVLAGALVAAHATGDPRLEALRAGTRAALRTRGTTAVSRGLLTHALDGWATPELAAFVTAVCGGDVGPDGPPPAGRGQLVRCGAGRRRPARAEPVVRRGRSRMRSIEVRRGSYVDSVTLMQVSRRVAALDGVTSALVAMATELNLDLAAGMGFDVPDTSPNELLVAVDAADDDALGAAAAEVDAALAEASRPAPSGFGSAPPPVTVRSAAARSEATVALISTPGQYAFADAVDAVDAGLLTMVFSDNVPVEQEVALKEYADRAGVLVMGPDCGTAVVGGVGLGFANVVRPGTRGHRRRLRDRRAAPDVAARRRRGRRLALPRGRRP